MSNFQTVSTDDIKKALEIATLHDLINSYVKRHAVELKANDKINEQVLEEFGENTNVIGIISDCHFRNELLADLVLINTTGDAEEKEQFLNLLKKHNYNMGNDLTWILYYLEKYTMGSWDYEQAHRHAANLLLCQSIQKRDEHTFELGTSLGDVTIYDASNYHDLSYNDRHCACHQVTGKALKEWKKDSNLYGFYFNVPLNFYGAFDHSVVVDLEKRIVIDIAKNFVVPLDYYLKLYGNPQFVISQSDFNEYDEIFKEEYGFNVTMDRLGEIQRIRKKQG